MWLHWKTCRLRPAPLILEAGAVSHCRRDRRQRRRDLPHTNLIEGRLMIELSRLYRALEAHQGILAALPRLPLGDTLRRELRRVESEDDTLSDPLPEPEPTPTT